MNKKIVTLLFVIVGALFGVIAALAINNKASASDAKIQSLRVEQSKLDFQLQEKKLEKAKLEAQLEEVNLAIISIREQRQVLEKEIVSEINTPVEELDFPSQAGVGKTPAPEEEEEPIVSVKKTEEQKEKLPAPTQRIVHSWFPEDSIETKIMNRVFWKKWWDALLTFQWENGAWNITRQSNYINDAGVRERSFGICQLMEKYHAKFIRRSGWTEVRPWYYKVNAKEAQASGFTDEFLDWEKHTDYCLSVWDDAMKKGRIATTFYAYSGREKYRGLFSIKEI